MATVLARGIEEQVAALGGDGQLPGICALCKKPNKVLCVAGWLEYVDGSSRACPNIKDDDML